MDPTPLLTAQQPIPLHAVAALVAMILGALQLAAPKGTRLHRWLGWTYVALLAGVAASGLFIHTIRWIGPFSPIHLLSVITLGSLVIAVRTAQRGNIRAHRAAMMALYLQALLLTGAFTLMPGRIMHEVLFG